jgi:hypothetical protein
MHQNTDIQFFFEDWIHLRNEEKTELQGHVKAKVSELEEKVHR